MSVFLFQKQSRPLTGVTYVFGWHSTSFCSFSFAVLEFPISSPGAAYQRWHWKVFLIITLNLIILTPHICSLPVTDRRAHTDCLREDIYFNSGISKCPPAMAGKARWGSPVHIVVGQEVEASRVLLDSAFTRGLPSLSPAHIQRRSSPLTWASLAMSSLTPSACLCIFRESLACTEVDLHTPVHH